MTIDEAYSFNEFASGGFTGVFLSGFDANNHVLHTALMWLSTALFGIHDFALRLPALAGSALFLWFLPQLVERVTPGDRRWMRLLLFLVLVLNPLTLDLLCAARGYSLALAFLTLALLRLSQYVATRRPRDLSWMSAFLGLACCANLSFAFVALATLGIALALVIRNGDAANIHRTLVPGVAILFTLLVLPLSRAERNNFYWGAKDLHESLQSTITPFLRHDPFLPGPFGSAKSVARMERRVLPAALLILAACGLLWFLRGRHPHVPPLIAVLFVTLFGYWLAHERFAVPYPSERTGVALVFLFFLTFGAAISVWRPAWRAPAGFWIASLPATLILAALLLQFLQQLQQPGYLWAWHEERDNRRIAALLRDRGAHRICAYWQFQPGLEWYRRAGEIPGAEPLTKYPGENPPLRDHDAYVLLRPDPARLASSGLAVAWTNSDTGVTVAVPLSGGLKNAVSGPN